MLEIPGKPDDGRVVVTIDYTVDGVHHCHEYPVTLEPERGDGMVVEHDTPVATDGVYPYESLRHTGEHILGLRVQGHLKDKQSFTVTTYTPPGAR